MLQPKVSIITVSYNAEKTIETTILSVLNQTYKNIEYIIIDGCSQDGTVDIIKKYEDKISYWVSEPDKGIYDAMNKGINKATGDIIGIINSDDWYENTVIEIVVCKLNENPLYYGVCGNILYCNEKGARIKNKTSRSKPYLCNMQRSMSIAHPSIFVKKDFYQKYGLFNTKYRIAADYELFLRAFTRKENILLYVPKINVNFRLGGASAQNSFLSIKEVKQIRKEHHVGVGKRCRFFLDDIMILAISIIRNYILKSIFNKG